VAVTRDSGTSAILIDILDRILDKGIVIDAWARVSLRGIDLLTADGHVVTASLENHLG
jgi:gas vesicle structural protein